MTLCLPLSSGSNTIDKFCNFMDIFRKQLSRIKTKTSESENALFTIIWKTTLFTSLSQKSKIQVFRKEFSSSDIKLKTLLKEETITGETLTLELRLKFMEESSRLLTLMSLLETFILTKEFKSEGLKHIQKILSFSLAQWSKWNRSLLIKLNSKSTMKLNWRVEDLTKDFNST